VTGLANPFFVVTSGTTLYFTLGGSNSDVLSVPVGGGTPTTIATAQKFPNGLALDSTYVYWGAFAANQGVAKYPRAGGPVTNVVSNGYSQCLQMAADGTNVYFGTYSSNGDVYQATPSGGNLVHLASGQTNPYAFAVDGSYVYWTDSTTLGAIMRVPIGGGTVTKLASDNIPNQIAVDAQAIYWASGGNGTIMKLAK
jgi:hypothetical protein